MEKLAYALYLFTLIFTPLAFGVIDPGPLFLMEGACLLSLLCCLFAQIRSGLPVVNVPGLTPLLFFLAWMAVQLIPLPLALVAVISPATAALYEPLQASGAASNPYVPFSVHPWHTLQDLFRFSAYAAFYFLTVQFLSEPKRMRQTLAVALTLAACIALFGIIQYYTDNGRLFWLRAFTHKQVFASFAYKNHFAAYAAMLLPLTLSLFFYHRPGRRSVSIKQAIIDLCNRTSDNQHLHFFLAALVIGLALLLSHSRGGVACSFISILVLLTLGRKRFKLNGLWILVLGLLAVLATGVGKDGLSTVDQGFGTALVKDGETLNGRLDFWKNALPILTDFPLTGTGGGTFRDVYPRYQHSASGAFPLHAHNDYVETLTNTGLIGSVAILLFLALFFRSTLAAYRKRRDGYVIHLYLGSLAGLIALLLHCMLDLQFRVSAAVGLYFFLLLGVNAASVALKQHRNSSSAAKTIRLTGWRGWCALALLCFASLLCCAVQIGELRALALFPELTAQEKRMGKAGYENRNELLALESFAKYQDVDAEQKQQTCNRAASAVRLDPLNPRYRHLRSLCNDADGQIDAAVADCRAALRLYPVQPLYYQQCAGLMEKKGDAEAAEQLFQAAILNDPSEMRFQRAALQHLLRAGKQEKALRLVADFLAQQPEKSTIILNDLESAGVTPAQAATVLPQRVAPFLALAAWWERIGDVGNAAQTYDLALSYLEHEKPVRAAFIRQPLRFYQQQKNEDKALTVLQQGVQFLPKEFEFRLQLGDLYSRQSMHHKALEQYQAALQLQPENEKIRQRLARITDILGLESR